MTYRRHRLVVLGCVLDVDRVYIVLNEGMGVRSDAFPPYCACLPSPDYGKVCALNEGV